MRNFKNPVPVLLILLALFILLGLESVRERRTQPTPTPVRLINPTATPFDLAEYPLAAQPIADAMADSAPWMLDAPVYRTDTAPDGSPLRYFNLPAVSSGEFSERQSGDATLDILSVYVLLPYRRAVAIPVVLGMATGGRYTSFSLPALDIPNRSDALAHLQAAYPHGQILDLTTTAEGNWVLQGGGFDWDFCPTAFSDFGLTLPAEMCAIGSEIERLSPGSTQQLTNRLPIFASADWLLIGWLLNPSPEQHIAIPQE